MTWRAVSARPLRKDVAAANRAMEEEMGWFADPLYTGDYPRSMRDRLGTMLPHFTAEQSAMLKEGPGIYCTPCHPTLVESMASSMSSNSC